MTQSRTLTVQEIRNGLIKRFKEESETYGEPQGLTGIFTAEIKKMNMKQLKGFIIEELGYESFKDFADLWC